MSSMWKVAVVDSFNVVYLHLSVPLDAGSKT